MSGVTEQPEGGNDVVRTQTFDASEPVELDLDLTAGTVEIRLTDEPGVSVEVRRAHTPGPSWAQGAAGVLNWVGEMFGGQGGPLAAPADAVQETRIEKLGDRVVVRGPKAPPPMGSPVAVTVRAPASSHVRARTRLAGVTVHGTCGKADVNTGSGSVTLDRAEGTTTVRTSSGEIDIATLSGPATVNGGGARVRLGEVGDAALVRTTSGEIIVGEAASGAVEAISGTGDIRVGIRPGVTAEIDLSSGAGSVHSDLDVSDSPPQETAALTVRARSGAGRVVVTRA